LGRMADEVVDMNAETTATQQEVPAFQSFA
jgi:hypothetical protein